MCNLSAKNRQHSSSIICIRCMQTMLSTPQESHPDKNGLAKTATHLANPEMTAKTKMYASTGEQHWNSSHCRLYVQLCMHKSYEAKRNQFGKTCCVRRQTTVRRSMSTRAEHRPSKICTSGDTELTVVIYRYSDHCWKICCPCH